MNFFQNILLKIFIGNKEKIVALALHELAKLYKESRAKLLQAVVDAVAQSPLAVTANDKELEKLMSALEQWFNAPEFEGVKEAVLAIFKK